MKLKVIAYEKVGDFHTCRLEDGKTVRIDLMVDGALGGKHPDIEPQDLVGKTVHVSYMHAYLMIGHDVEIAEDDQ